MSLPTRFTEKFAVDGDCWVWSAGIGRDGYGRYSVRSVPVLAHRFAYEAVVGPIPEGLQIDHLCRNRACVNPDHLEAVTQRENILRGEGVSARQARQTHCINGHAFDDENTHVNAGHRICRTCNRERVRRYYERARKRAA